MAASQHLPIQAEDVLRADVTLTVDADVPQEALAGLADRLQVDVVVHCDDPRFAALVPHVRVRVREADMAADDDGMGDGDGHAATDVRADGMIAEPGGTGTPEPVPTDDAAAALAPRRAIVSMDSASTDAERMFRETVIALESMPGNQVEGVSPLYHISDIEGPDGMAAVMQLATRMGPRALIAALQHIESAYGDAIDLDLVDYEGVSSDDPECRIPWPSASRRAAVLAPWLDMDPDARLGGDPVSYLLAMAPDSMRVGLLSDDWILGGAL
ncbi:2-amino-4-hydroxy-6-hydroxymethyldihydropteridine diphosphokinase [Bifidobacterium pullorum]|uniref:2-amino-4-hydroxy-6- hydroxymethyldihydropteridine diphosphokinase n=1 Tax=Bifidobacterium pullorum TaxID=78448 RepID=UPI003AF51E79